MSRGKSGIVELVVNGEPVRLTDAKDRTLLEALRDDLGLWGVKNGCGTGHCGACTVVVDGRAVLSCKTLLSDIHGSYVQTVEGLGTPDHLHPLQEAFIRHDAIQCGFCTPGMLMAASALLNENPSPSEEEIRRALRRNLCRCTGYGPIVKAIQAAANGHPEEYALSYQRRDSGIGGNPVRKEAVEKATGRAAYAADRARPNMLHAAALHPDVPHARILRVDVQKAAEAPGVVAVLTAKDVPGPNRFGNIRRDQPVLCDEVVRFLGDTIALVVAESDQAARAALPLIEVDYEELRRVTSLDEARAQDAPQLHPDGNVLCHLELKRGDVDKALREAAVVVEDTYTTPFVEHAYLEPEACLAEPDDVGGVTIWTSQQNPFSDRQQVAEALDLPVEKVRIVLTTIGGAFGGREDITIQLQAALAAMKTGKPVKMVANREESLLTSVKRHASRVHYVSAADEDGRLLGIRVRVELDTGAYASVGSIVAMRSLTHAGGAYALDNVDVEVDAIYTNNPVAGAFRGFGSPQVAFAAEMQMDRLADRLGIDPLEIRLRNAADVGSPLSTGQILEHSAGLKETLRKAAQVAGWENREKGFGVACCLKNVGLGHGSERDKSGVILEIGADGRILVRTGASEVGQGLKTALSQITAQGLGARYRDIRVQHGDTGETPDSGVTSASRQTFTTGNACLEAAKEVREELIKRASEMLKLPAEDLTCGDSQVFSQTAPDQKMSFGALAETFPNGTLKKEVLYRPPVTHPLGTHGPDGLYRTHHSYGYGTQIASVDVDESTGRLTVKRLIVACDVGKAIFRPGVVGQSVGAAVMGMGFATSEEFRVENAVPKTRTLGACRIPRIDDVPEIDVVIVEDPEMFGPYGAKGVGELALVPTAPAIANAVHDATGVWITDLPLTPERIRQALNARGEEDN
jgi:selenium-dependent xanthine dehydrogenase